MKRILAIARGMGALHDTYSLTDDVIAPDDTQPPGAHVVDYELQRLLSKGWQRYVHTVLDPLPDMPVPAVRVITTSFEAECAGGDRLVRGVRAAGRTRRSWLVEEALWQADSEQVVATSRVVLLGIDRSTGRAAPIPDEMWGLVEELEGRAIPMTETLPA